MCVDPSCFLSFMFIIPFIFFLGDFMITDVISLFEIDWKFVFVTSFFNFFKFSANESF